jgi:divalent metal cation (Fe/Co/Zn/Cd) transporter
VRGSGNQIFVDLRVAVPRHLSFEESHAVTQQIQDAVRAITPNADVVINTIPVSENEGVLERIQVVAARGHFDVHNITTHLTKRGMWIDLDLEVPPDVSFDQAHAIATDLEERLHTEFKPVPANANDQHSQHVADINVHIEPRAEELVTGIELAPAERRKFIERINAVRAEIPHARACADIDVQRLDGSVYLALHLLIDPQLSMADVHSVCEEMENRLRREFPQLGRVVIHAEPYQNK